MDDNPRNAICHINIPGQSECGYLLCDLLTRSDEQSWIRPAQPYRRPTGPDGSVINTFAFSIRRGDSGWLLSGGPGRMSLKEPKGLTRVNTTRQSHSSGTLEIYWEGGHSMLVSHGLPVSNERCPD